MSTTLKKFYCPLHGTQENVRVAGVQVMNAEDRTIKVQLECLSCPDHLATHVFLPFETMGNYDLPELGSNIYSPLTIALIKKDQEDKDQDDQE